MPPEMVETSFDVIQFLTNTVTKDNITLAIAILGAVGTVSGYFKQRCRFSVEILEHITRDSGLFFQLLIQNHSSTPVSVNGVQIRIGSTRFEICKDSLEVTYSVVSYSPVTLDHVYTTEFPVRLEVFESQSVWVCLPELFQAHQDKQLNLSIEPLFVLQTTRGVKEVNQPRLVQILRTLDEKNR